MYIYISIQIYSKYMNIKKAEKYKKRSNWIYIYIKDHKTIAQSEKLREGRERRRGRLKRVAQPWMGDLGEKGIGVKESEMVKLRFEEWSNDPPCDIVNVPAPTPVQQGEAERKAQ